MIYVVEIFAPGDFLIKAKIFVTQRDGIGPRPPRLMNNCGTLFP